VPGPGDVVPSAVFGEVYDRYDIEWSEDDYPLPRELEQWATDAGWIDVTADADPTTAIPLADEAAFWTWLRVARTVSDWSSERIEAYGRDLMAASPIGADGSFRIPFGSVYLTARKAAA
jgi:hypothetical protein